MRSRVLGVLDRREGAEYVPSSQEVTASFALVVELVDTLS